MKIRNGFVSNSSSSSFVILGAAINDSELKDIFGKDVIYDLDDVIRSNGLIYERSDDGETTYIGVSPWAELGEHETKAQLKYRIATMLKKINITCSVEYYAGTTYN